MTNVSLKKKKNQSSQQLQAVLDKTLWLSLFIVCQLLICFRISGLIALDRDLL